MLSVFVTALSFPFRKFCHENEICPPQVCRKRVPQETYVVRKHVLVDVRQDRFLLSDSLMFCKQKHQALIEFTFLLLAGTNHALLFELAHQSAQTQFFKSILKSRIKPKSSAIWRTRATSAQVPSDQNQKQRVFCSSTCRSKFKAAGNLSVLFWKIIIVLPCSCRFFLQKSLRQSPRPFLFNS